MLNGKVMIIVLIVGLIKNISYKNEPINHLEVLEELLTLKLVCLIKQQKLI